MDHGYEADLRHPRAVGEDPLAVERDALEARVEADADQPELVFAAIHFGEPGFAVARLDDANGSRKAFGETIAVARDGIVLRPRVHDAAGAQIAVARGSRSPARHPRSP